MSQWRVLNKNVPGTADRFGPDDFDKTHRMFNGEPNVGAPVINVDWTFGDSRCKFVNPQNGKVVSIRTLFNTQTLAYYLPQPASTNDDTLVANNAPAVLTNKTIDSIDNNIIGVQKMPLSSKTGGIYCGPTVSQGAAYGLLVGFVNDPGIPVSGTDFTYGTYWRYSSTATANTRTGLRMDKLFTAKELLCRTRAKTRVNTITNSRQYIGFSSNVSIPASGTPFSTNESGLLVGWRGDDANIHVFHNSGSASGTSTLNPVNTGIPRSTAVRTFDVSFIRDPANTNVIIGWVRIWNELNGLIYNQTITSNLPPTNTLLSPSVNYSDSSTQSRTFDVFGWEMEQKS